MPKSKKKGKKKSGKKKSGKKSGGKSAKESSAKTEPEIQSENEKEDEDDIFTDKEELLKDELMKVMKDIETTKEMVESLKLENKDIENECEKVRKESEEICHYHEERARMMATKDITLQQYYHSLRNHYNAKQDKITYHHNLQKEELNSVLEEKNNNITTLKETIKEFDEYLNQRADQEKEIERLDKEIQSLRIKQANDLECLKLRLEEEYTKAEIDAHNSIKEIKNDAYHEALMSLQSTFTTVQKENQEYKHEIISIIKSTKMLNIKKFKLEEDNKRLLEDLKFATDFAHLRNLRQKKPLELETSKRIDEKAEEYHSSQVSDLSTNEV